MLSEVLSVERIYFQPNVKLIKKQRKLIQSLIFLKFKMLVLYYFECFKSFQNCLELFV